MSNGKVKDLLDEEQVIINRCCEKYNFWKRGLACTGHPFLFCIIIALLQSPTLTQLYSWSTLTSWQPRNILYDFRGLIFYIIILCFYIGGLTSYIIILCSYTRGLIILHHHTLFLHFLCSVSSKAKSIYQQNRNWSFKVILISFELN